MQNTLLPSALKSSFNPNCLRLKVELYTVENEFHLLISEKPEHHDDGKLANVSAHCLQIQALPFLFCST